MASNKNKFIFIDTNIFRSLFTESEAFSDNIIKLLTKLVEKKKVVLLLPQQVKDEITRNKISLWVDEEINRIDNRIKDAKTKIDFLVKQFDNTTYVTKTPTELLTKQIKREIKRLEKYKEEVSKRFFSPRNKANINLNKVFKLATLIEETKDIKNDAFFRREKNNPPYDGSKYGDKLIWESILDYFLNNKSTNIELVFVARDKTAWSGKGEGEFNVWLSNEFKQKTGGKIILASDLSEIPILTKKEQKEISEEEFKNTADSKLKYANTFSTADNVMRIIMNKMNLVDANLVEKLLIATVKNNKNTTGPYNQALGASKIDVFLRSLLQHCFSNKYDLGSWKQFYNDLDDDEKERFLEIRKKLKQHGVTGIVNPRGEEFLDPEDLPF